VLGRAEAVTPDVALAMVLADPALRPGAGAHLCLLDRPLGEALAHPSHRRVRATVIGGSIVFSR
jgi:predicted amidohydrolase YtcJ